MAGRRGLLQICSWLGCRVQGLAAVRVADVNVIRASDGSCCRLPWSFHAAHDRVCMYQQAALHSYIHQCGFGHLQGSQLAQQDDVGCLEATMFSSCTCPCSACSMHLRESLGTLLSRVREEREPSPERWLLQLSG